MVKPNDPEIVRSFLKEHGAILISEKCTTRMRIEFKCRCGKNSTKKLECLKNNPYCKECTKNIVDRSPKHFYTIKEIKKLLKEKECHIISDEYHSKEKIKYKCKCGVKTEKFVYQLFKQPYCRDCHFNAKRLKYDDVKQIVENVGCELLSTEYITAKENLHIKCPCGNTYWRSFDMFNGVKKQIRCLECSKHLMEQNNIEKYGTKCTLQNPEISKKSKETIREKYGVENAMQDPMIFNKSIKNSKRYKIYTFPNGKTRKVQGYEPFCLDNLIKNGYAPKDICTKRKKMPVIKYYNPIRDKMSVYYPDIFIKNENKIIEVKSEYTYKLHRKINRAKRKATVKAGYSYELQIYTPNGILIRQKKYY